MDDLDLRDGAPLWARVLWFIARRVAGLAWLGVRVWAATWLARLLVLVRESYCANCTIWCSLHTTPWFCADVNTRRGSTHVRVRVHVRACAHAHAHENPEVDCFLSLYISFFI